MARLSIEASVINGLLNRYAADYQLQYRSSCLLGRVKLPLSALTMVAIPSCTSSHLVLTLPFQEIKGEGTPAFLVPKLVGAFWGTIQKQVDGVLLPKLAQAGLPPDSVMLQRLQTPAGDIGQITVSLEAIDGWLSVRHPRLSVKVQAVEFASQSVVVLASLDSKAALKSQGLTD